MEIFIIYVIKTLLLPLASLLLLGISGLFLLKQRGFAVYLIGFSLATLFLLSLPIVAKLLAATHEKYRPLDMSTIDDFEPQAIVVLGGGLRDAALEYTGQVTLNRRTLARVRYSAILAKQTQLPILVTGGKVLKSDLPSEAEVMADVLNHEYRQTVRWQEQRSRNTAENARYSKEILRKEGIKRIILVTHALHMTRAIEQFRQHGLQVLPAPTEFISKSRQLSLFRILPSAGALANSSLVIHEIMGRAWYKLRYSIK